MSENDLKTIRRFQVALPILRTSLGLTQLDLAKYLDIPKTTIEVIESCKKPTNLVFFWALFGLISSLATATKNEDTGWLYMILLNTPDEKLRQEAVDFCLDIVKETDSIGIAKTQTKLREEFHKWVQNNIDELKKYFEEKK